MTPAVTDDTDRPTTNTLESWKAIARYLQRDVRTVQRWEQEEGLPVHRHHHGKQATVYAVPAEIDAWRESLDASPSPQTRAVHRGLVFAVIVGAALIVGGYLSNAVMDRDDSMSSPSATADDAAIEPGQRETALDAELNQAWEALHSFDPSALNGAETSFRDAADAMPVAVEPLVGRALTNVVMAFFQVKPAMEAYANAEQFALEALKLDAGQGEAMAVLGYVEFIYRWNWEGAERLMLESVDADPGSVWTHLGLANYYSALGRGEESIIQIDRALAVKPDSAFAMVARGYMLNHAGRHRDAVEYWEDVVDRLGFQRIGDFMREAYEEAGDFESAISVSKHMGSPFIEMIETGYRDGGPRGYWAAKARIMEQRLNRYPDAFSHRLAIAAANGGEHELALSMLERGYHRRDPRMVFLPVYPLEPLYDEPAFQAMVSDMGLDFAFEGRLP